MIEGNIASVDAAADLGRTVTFCAKHDLGGMEGLIGVPGTVGGALRMNAGAYGMQIGSLRPRSEGLPGGQRQDRNPQGRSDFLRIPAHFFCADDMMLAVKLELPSKPYRRNSQRDSYLQRKAARQPAAWAEERRLHFQEPAGRFRRPDD